MNLANMSNVDGLLMNVETATNKRVVDNSNAKEKASQDGTIASVISKMQKNAFPMPMQGIREGEYNPEYNPRRQTTTGTSPMNMPTKLPVTPVQTAPTVPAAPTLPNAPTTGTDTIPNATTNTPTTKKEQSFLSTTGGKLTAVVALGVLAIVIIKIIK